jgi:Methyltransferase domain
MQILKKVTSAKRLIATHGAVATLRYTSVWTSRRFRHVFFGTPLGWRKFQLMNELAGIHGYRSILEISTAGSGFTYGQLDRTRFDVCRRLSYLTPDAWTDGAPVDYRSRDADTSECLRKIRAHGQRFDIVFIDACHEYESTRRDMLDALSLVNENGVIVMHDCLPESEAICTPSRGNLNDWSGVTYKAYLDVLMTRSDLWYCSVNTDYGCGMIRSKRKTHVYKRTIDLDPAYVSTWQNVGDNYNAAFQLYYRNRDTLMNVVTVSEFLTAEWRNRTIKT